MQPQPYPVAESADSSEESVSAVEEDEPLADEPQVSQGEEEQSPAEAAGDGLAAEESPDEPEFEEPEDRPNDPAAFFQAALKAAANGDPHEASSDLEDAPLMDDEELARMEAAFADEGDNSGWEDPDADETPAAPRPQQQTRRKPQPPRKKKKTDDGPGKLTLDEAIQRVSPDARRVLETTLKGQFREVRRYAP